MQIMPVTSAGPEPRNCRAGKIIIPTAKQGAGAGLEAN